MTNNDNKGMSDLLNGMLRGLLSSVPHPTGEVRKDEDSEIRSFTVFSDFATPQSSANDYGVETDEGRTHIEFKGPFGGCKMSWGENLYGCKDVEFRLYSDGSLSLCVEEMSNRGACRSAYAALTPKEVDLLLAELLRQREGSGIQLKQ